MDLPSGMVTLPQMGRSGGWAGAQQETPEIISVRNQVAWPRSGERGTERRGGGLVSRLEIQTLPLFPGGS